MLTESNPKMDNKFDDDYILFLSFLMWDHILFYVKVRISNLNHKSFDSLHLPRANGIVVACHSIKGTETVDRPPSVVSLGTPNVLGCDDKELVCHLFSLCKQVSKIKRYHKLFVNVQEEEEEEEEFK